LGSRSLEKFLFETELISFFGGFFYALFNTFKENLLKEPDPNRRFLIPMYRVTSMVPETFTFTTPEALKKAWCILQ